MELNQTGCLSCLRTNRMRSFFGPVVLGKMNTPTKCTIHVTQIFVHHVLHNAAGDPP